MIIPTKKCIVHSSLAGTLVRWVPLLDVAEVLSARSRPFHSMMEQCDTGRQASVSQSTGFSTRISWQQLPIQYHVASIPCSWHSPTVDAV